MTSNRTSALQPANRWWLTGVTVVMLGLGAVSGCDRYQAGRAALEAGNPARAARLIHPRDVAGHLLRGRAFLAAGDAGHAAAEARAALRRRPRRAASAQAYALLGRAELAAGYRSRSLEAFAHAQRLVPGCCGVREPLGRLLLERAEALLTLGRRAAAQADLATATRLGQGGAERAARVRDALAAASPGAPASAPARPLVPHGSATGADACRDSRDPEAPVCRSLEEQDPVTYARVARERAWSLFRPATVMAVLASGLSRLGELDDLIEVGPTLRLLEDGETPAGRNPARRSASLPAVPGPLPAAPGPSPAAPGPSPAAPGPLVRAAIYRLAGKEPAARRMLDELLAASGQDPAVRRRIAEEALLWGDLTAADRHLRWAEALGGLDGRVAETRALMARLDGDRATEWQVVVAGARRARRPADALAALGARFRERGELAAAAVLLAEASRRGGRDDVARLLRQTLTSLVGLWRALGRPGREAALTQLLDRWRQQLGEETVADLRRAVEARLDATPEARARTLLVAGNPRAALAALAGVVTGHDASCRHDGPEPLVVLRSRILHALGDREAALALLADDADRPVARGCRYPRAIRVLEELGEHAAALRLARALKDEAPDDPDVRLALGRLKLLANDPPGAALDLEAAVYHSRDRAAAFDEVARAYQDAGLTRQSCAAYGRALAFRRGKHRPTLLRLGHCLLADGQEGAARLVLGAFVRLASSSQRVAAGRLAAEAYLLAGERDQARAVADDVALATLGDRAVSSQALSQLEQAATRRPLSPELFVARAEVHAARGEGAQGLALLRRAQAIQPRSRTVLRAAARLLGRLQGPEAEAELLSLSQVPDPAVRCAANLSLAGLYQDLEEVDRARAALQALQGCDDPALRRRARRLAAGLDAKGGPPTPRASAPRPRSSDSAPAPRRPGP